MVVRWLKTASNSLRARFLAVFAIGAIIVTITGAWATYSAAQQYLQQELIKRGQLLASAINHAAMIATDDADLFHVIENLRLDNPDIMTIAVLDKASRGLIAISNRSEQISARHADMHLWDEAYAAMENGHFGSHIEGNLEFVALARLNFREVHPASHHNNFDATGTPDENMDMSAGHGMHAGPQSLEQEAVEPPRDRAVGAGFSDLAPHSGHVAGEHRPVEPSIDPNDASARHEIGVQDSSLRGAIVVHLDRSGAIATQTAILQKLIPTTLFGILIIMGLAWSVLQTQIIEPIADIQRTMRRQQSGDRKARARAQATNELNDVANSFNVMIEAMAAREKTIEEQANQDSLTGLPNRKSFAHSFAVELQNAKANDEKLRVAFLDLDNFKIINDSKGHIVGDEVLKTVTARMMHCVPQPHIIARLGGDEFAIIFIEGSTTETLEAICSDIIEAVHKPVLVDNVEVMVGVTIGISHFPEHGKDQFSLLKFADLALYQAKERHRGSWLTYNEQMGDNAQEDRAIERDLRLALEHDELFLAFQPQINVRTGRLSGVEALVRWQHPERGMVLPTRFIEIAETSGLINTLGTKVLFKACAQAARWENQGLPPLTMGVNVSAKQLQDPTFVNTVRQAIDETGIDPSRLELELTETAIMTVGDHVIDTMRQLGDLGVRLAIDDFGTGHSSLSRLKHLPLDRLKIDRSFVADALPGSDNMIIASAIIQLAKSLDMNVIAEGVETQEQFDFITQEGCHDVQGFLFGRPMTAKEFSDWFAGGALTGLAALRLREIANTPKAKIIRLQRS